MVEDDDHPSQLTIRRTESPLLGRLDRSVGFGGRVDLRESTSVGEDRNLGIAELCRHAEQA
jgi:hypothetical protein